MSISSVSLSSRLSRRFALGSVFATGALASILATSPASADNRGEDLDACFAETTPSVRDVFLNDIELHPGVTSNIHLRVVSRPGPGCGRKAIVAVPGAACTANVLVALGEAILASSDNGGGERVCNYISVDLPGHGESQVVGEQYGDIHFSDFTAGLVGTLERLNERGIETPTLVGHSLGGAVVLLAQQSLVDHGSNLRDAFGVKHLVGLAPGAWPQGITCALCQNPNLATELAAFEVVDPVLGPILQLTPQVWIGLIFPSPAGTFPPDTPTPAQVIAGGFDTPESLTALDDDIGAPTPLDSGIFSNRFGTKLDVINYQNDGLIPPVEGEELYQYLTGEDPLAPESRWVTVGGANATHAMPMAAPAEMLAALPAKMVAALQGR